MAVTLRDVFANWPADVRSDIVKGVEETSPIWGMLPFRQINSGVYRFTREGALPATDTRALNEAYADAKTTYNPAIVELSYIGNQIPIDRKLANRNQSNNNSVLANQIASASRAIGLNAKAKFINGDRLADARDFDGLKAHFDQSIIPAAQTVLYEGAANGSVLTSAAAVIDNMNSLLEAVDNPTLLTTSEILLGQIDALIATGNNAVLAQRFTWDPMPTTGFTHRTARWDGIPFIPMGTDGAGAAIMDFDETTGSSGITQSIYAISTQMGQLTMLTDGPPEIASVPTNNGQNLVLDWGISLAIERTKGVGRLQGILTS